MSTTLPEAQQRRLIGLLREVARPLIMSVCRTRTNCIAATKIIVDTLQSYGIEARALPCQLRVRNAVHLYQLDAWRRSNGDTPAPEFMQRHWRDDLGAWAVYVGYGSDNPNDTGYDGHLVVHVPLLQLAIDASIDQVDRPEKKIGPMPPVLVFKWDAQQFNHVHTDDIDGNGTRVEYTRADGRDDYVTAPDWINDTAHIVTSLRLAIASRGVERDGAQHG